MERVSLVLFHSATRSFGQIRGEMGRLLTLEMQHNGMKGPFVHSVFSGDCAEGGRALGNGYCGGGRGEGGNRGVGRRGRRGWNGRRGFEAPQRGCTPHRTLAHELRPPLG